MKKNKLRIHVDTGNIYYDNFNTNKSIYDFLLAQQNSYKKLLNIKFFLVVILISILKSILQV